MISAHNITSMAPKVIAIFSQHLGQHLGQHLDQIDVNINGICCIVVFEDITSAPLLINTIDCKDAQLEILYSVGSVISALHEEGIAYRTFNIYSICLQDNSIRLRNIGQNFEFEISIGVYQRREMDCNDCYIPPELICDDAEIEEHRLEADAYSFGMVLFTIIFQEYGIFPMLDINGRAYGSRNPVQSEVIENHKAGQLAIWNELPQDLKNLFGGLPNTYPSPDNPSRRIGGFVCGTEQFIADTDQPVRGLLYQNPTMRLTISESLNNEWFKHIEIAII